MSSKPLRNIIYAEDEVDIQEIAKIALEDLGGFNVIYCKNGHEVLDAVQKGKPDLLLLDVMMPEMDGLTTFKILRNTPEYKAIPTIFMTAKIQAEETDCYREIGALDVIAKPFDPMILADLIKTAWNKLS